MTTELEPLPPKVDALLRALPPPPPLPSAALKAGVGARIVQTLAAPVAGAAAVGTSALLKVGLPMALMGVVVGAVGATAIDRLFFFPAPLVVVQPLPVAPVLRVEPPVPATAPEPAAVPAPAPAVQAARPRVAVPSSEERQLIEVARTALVKHEPLAALEVTAAHRQRFARGQLAEERDSLEVQALAQAGRAEEARAAARAFLRRYPASIFGPAVEAAAGSP